MQDFERDPLFKMDDIHDISKEQLRERTMEKVVDKHLHCVKKLNLNMYSFVVCCIIYQMKASISLKKEWRLLV
jgi:hypothetical protein